MDKRKHFKLFLAFIGQVPAVKWWKVLPELHRRSSLLARWHDRVVFKYIRGKAAPGHVECHEDTSGLVPLSPIPFRGGGMFPRISTTTTINKLTEVKINEIIGARNEAPEVREANGE